MKKVLLFLAVIGLTFIMLSCGNKSKDSNRLIIHLVFESSGNGSYKYAC